MSYLAATSAALRSTAAAAQPVAAGDEAWRITMTAVIAAAWLAFAVWAVIRGARAQLQARLAQAWGLRLRGLLATAPGAYLIVAENGAASCSDSLRAWLDLDKKPGALEDLAPHGDSGLTADDFQLLTRDIAALAVSGNSFTRLVRAAGTGRVLLAQGRAAPTDLVGERGVVVWFTDTTQSQASVEALRQETEKLTTVLESTTTILEAAPFPIWQRGPDLKLRHVNAAYVQAVEVHSAEEAVRQGVELVNNALSTAPETSARRARDLGETQVREEPVIIGGARRMLQIYDVPLGASGVGSFAIDVTDREEARAELGRFIRAQTDTLDRLSTSVALFAADRTLSFFNKAFAALFQLDAQWLEEERPEFDRVLERMREARRLPEQRDFPNWRRARRAWFTELLDATEETWVLPDNTVVRVIAQPHPAGGLLLIFEDRTEQLKLASSRDTLLRVQAATLNNLHEAVAVFSGDGRMQLWNAGFGDLWDMPAEMLVEKPHVDELLGVAADRLADPTLASGLRDLVRIATVGREQRAGVIEMRDGRIISYGAVPLPDGNALLTFRDITDSRRIETALRDRNEALEAADRLKSAFVANVSYELRTPLTAISGFAEMLSQGYAGTLSERQSDYVNSILTSSERLQLLINDILDLAVTEAGELELDIEVVPVDAMVQSVAAMAQEASTMKSQRIDIDIQPGIGTIEGDKRRLQQALYNVLANAVRFTPPGGRALVRATGTADQVNFIVSDTGIGIREEEQAFVFDRFRKGSNAGKDGVGLGLALVRQFVELHGGTVGLTSTLGQGTTVTITLPRHQKRERKAATA